MYLLLKILLFSCMSVLNLCAQDYSHYPLSTFPTRHQVNGDTTLIYSSSDNKKFLLLVCPNKIDTNQYIPIEKRMFLDFEKINCHYISVLLLNDSLKAYFRELKNNYYYRIVTIDNSNLMIDSTFHNKIYFHYFTRGYNSDSLKWLANGRSAYFQIISEFKFKISYIANYHNNKIKYFKNYLYSKFTDSIPNSIFTTYFDYRTNQKVMINESTDGQILAYSIKKIENNENGEQELQREVAFWEIFDKKGYLKAEGIHNHSMLYKFYVDSSLAHLEYDWRKIQVPDSSHLAEPLPIPPKSDTIKIIIDNSDLYKKNRKNITQPDNGDVLPSGKPTGVKWRSKDQKWNYYDESGKVRLIEEYEKGKCVNRSIRN
jgi:hypothetical protein